MEKKPTVSVLLTSYNHEKFIREAIDSVLSQTYSDFELIIWDDASTDSSWDIIQSYKDPRIKAFRNGVNERKVINKILRSGQVRGRYVAIHHSDDVWEPEKLEKQVAFLEQIPRYGAVFTQASPMDETGGALGDATHFYASVFDQPNRTRQEWLRYFFTTGNALCHPSMLIRKACYDTLGIYPYPLVQLPDFDLWIRLAMRYELYILPEKLVRFRVRDHEANVSGNRRDTRIRGYVEYYQVLAHYRNLSSFDDLLRIFPEAAPYDRGEHTDVQFVLGRVGLEQARHPFVQLFCLNLLYEALGIEQRRNAIAEQYGFTYRSLMGLAAEYDVFSQEAVRRLHYLANNDIAYSGLYLFDASGALIKYHQIEVNLNGDTPHFVFKLDEPTAFESFRWDPIENAPCTVSLISTIFRDENTGVDVHSAEVLWHNGEEKGGHIQFNTADPQLHYPVPGKTRYVEIVARVSRMGIQDFESHLMMDARNKVEAIAGENRAKTLQITGLEAELKDTRQLLDIVLADLLQKNDHILNLIELFKKQTA